MLEAGRKDRLSVIAAIAKQMSDARGTDIYLAGLWQHTLILDLTWNASGPRVELATNLPTWSWARRPEHTITWPSMVDGSGQLSNVRVLRSEC